MSMIDQRNPLQILEDAIVLKRVKDGIAVLEGVHGPDWADKIDLNTLDLGSARACVLGQVYGPYVVRPGVDDAAIQRYREDIGGDDETALVNELNVASGYDKGLYIVNGPLTEEGPATYGFDAGYQVYLGDLPGMTDEALAKIGVTREQAVAAIEWHRQPGNRPYWMEDDEDRILDTSYTDLNGAWTDEIQVRQTWWKNRPEDWVGDGVEA